jgi:hypothetical protein
VQGIREHNPSLGLGIGPDELPVFAFTSYEFFQTILLGTLLVWWNLIIDHNDCDGDVIEKQPISLACRIGPACCPRANPQPLG